MFFNFNPSKLLFTTLLFMGTLMVISANSWLATWMGLEINLLSFIPLISETKNIFTSEACLQYFLIQAIASTFFLFIIIFSSININNYLNPLPSNIFILISLPLLLKMGAAPFHQWFPKVMEGLSWMNCFILMSWQKLAPFLILTYFMKNSLWFLITSLTSIIMGSLGGLNQTSLRKILSYSSINHIGWLISSLMINNSIWKIYFFIYSLISLAIILVMEILMSSHVNQFLSKTFLMKSPLKLFFCLNLLSLGGLPPFLGFFPKWIIIENLSSSMNFKFLIVIMTITTLLTLFYYLRLSFSILLLSSFSLKNFIFLNTPAHFLNTFLSSLSVVGLPLLIFIFNFL